MVTYNNLEEYYKGKAICLPIFYHQGGVSQPQKNSIRNAYKNVCFLSVIFAFSIGLLIGIFIPLLCLQKIDSNKSAIPQNLEELTVAKSVENSAEKTKEILSEVQFGNSEGSFDEARVFDAYSGSFQNYEERLVNDVEVQNKDAKRLENTANKSVDKTIKSIFLNNSYGSKKDLNDYSTVKFIERSFKEVPTEESVVVSNIYWGPKIEKNIPQGFDKNSYESWKNFVQNSEAVKLEPGCGRMQNRLVTFRDGSQGCVRYRQNTDQIQGELFSFYLAQILNLRNLAPSTVSVVDLKDNIWKNLAHDISSAQWNSNRPVVLTKFIKNLDSANIPNIFKPESKHLNKDDISNITSKNQGANVLQSFVELAQWSDLIIFDYLTANLDRIVNNLYNYQWNTNIMDSPAHNLAKKIDSNLLVFLDNESGLLHGYRLLKKYEVYHTILLDNLCMFRKSTADTIRKLRKEKNVGFLLRQLFESNNDSKIKDVLPTLPDKSIKILNERIDKVYNQIVKCEAIFSEDGPT